MTRVTALVLDFDGVVVDSEAQNAALLRSYFRQRFSVGITSEDEAAVYGYPWAETFTTLFERYGLRQDPATIMPDFMAAKLRAIGADPPRVATGLRDLLALPLPKAIVTGSVRVEVEAMMRLAGLPATVVDAILTADDVRQSKPHPEGYLRACELLGARPGEAMAFEDSRPGIAAARAAGTAVAWVRELAHEDNAAAADVVFATLAEAAPWVRQRMAGGRG